MVGHGVVVVGHGVVVVGHGVGERKRGERKRGGVGAEGVWSCIWQIIEEPIKWLRLHSCDPIKSAKFFIYTHP